MPRRGPRLVIALLALTLVLGSVVGRVLGLGDSGSDTGTAAVRVALSGSSLSTTDPAAVDPATVDPAGGDCADLLLLGVDGNGETPRPGDRLGRTLHVAERAWSRSAAAAGRSVEVRRVGAATLPPSELVALPKRPAREAVGPRRAKTWRQPVPAGVRAAWTVLRTEQERCPGQSVVLAGYAQGAAVAHRVLERLRRRDRLETVVGALLVSDPERRAYSAAGRVLGVPSAPAGGRGILTRLFRPRPDVPRPTATFGVWQVCTAGDLVCDPRRTTVRTAVGRATGYRFGEGARQVRRAARDLYRLSLLRPVPQPAVQTVEVGVGERVDLRLTASVAESAADGLAWEALEALPPGLVLEPDGTVSGSVEEQGSWQVPVAVHGTDPVTPSAAGVLVVVARTEAAWTAAGGEVSCEIRVDGTAWCWGRNNWGQLGDGAASGPRPTPVQVGADDDWEQLETSGSTTCGIRTDGTLWCWGLNHVGQLGIGGGGPRAVPTQVGSATTWTGVSPGWFHTCGTRSNGTLWCWGLGGRGQLGHGSTRSWSRPQRVGDARDWDTVAVGGWFGCGTRAGTLWCWGQNDQGQLGLGPAGQRRVPTRVGEGADWASVATSWAHTCALTEQGAAWCWGDNEAGQLGDGTRVGRRTPTPVPGPRVWTTLATGDAATCGVDATGGAWCWGSNRYGQLGGGESQDRLEPVRVASEEPMAEIDTGWLHACGRLVDGPTACWGNNEQGQIGDGTRTDGPQPKEVR